MWFVATITLRRFVAGSGRRPPHQKPNPTPTGACPLPPGADISRFCAATASAGHRPVRSGASLGPNVKVSRWRPPARSAHAAFRSAALVACQDETVIGVPAYHGPTIRSIARLAGFLTLTCRSGSRSRTALLGVLRSDPATVRARRRNLWLPNKLHFGTAGWAKQNGRRRSSSFHLLHDHRLCAGMAETLAYHERVDTELSHVIPHSMNT
jgi:hypothetical protein